jgi:hypothetical protein
MTGLPGSCVAIGTLAVHDTRTVMSQLFMAEDSPTHERNSLPRRTNCPGLSARSCNRRMPPPPAPPGCPGVKLDDRTSRPGSVSKSHRYPVVGFSSNSRTNGVFTGTSMMLPQAEDRRAGPAMHDTSKRILSSRVVSDEVRATSLTAQGRVGSCWSLSACPLRWQPRKFCAGC